MRLHHRPRVSRRGFTLVELLVVVGIIGLLVSILLPSLNNAREQARKTQCAAGLHNIGIAMNVYANENRRKLPAHSGVGNNWLWDIPIPTRDAIVKAGAERSNFYCPSGDLQNDDTLWNYNGWCVSGYWWMMARFGGPLSGGGQVIQNYPPPQYDENFRKLRTRIDHPRSSELELVADANLSTGTPPNRKFAGVDGGWPNHRSNHVKRGWQGVGGQILFLDGHVAWRDISDMKIRFQPGHDEWF
jgi:prepilin-type N-terminal cleavage/methylation domain-containing protein/prepilin-type processing-associated H-X9-DG protein